jgi:hypothetical protein
LTINDRERSLLLDRSFALTRSECSLRLETVHLSFFEGKRLRGGLYPPKSPKAPNSNKLIYTRFFALQSRKILAEPEASRPPSEKVNLALIGCGGRNTGDAKDAHRFGSIIAVWDMDACHVAAAQKEFPGAEDYADFRRLLSSLQ